MHIAYVQRLVYASSFNKHFMLQVYFRYLYILTELLKKNQHFLEKTYIPNKGFKTLKCLKFIASCTYNNMITFEDKSI